MEVEFGPMDTEEDTEELTEGMKQFLESAGEII
jgi:hypothetical protein